MKISETPKDFSFQLDEFYLDLSEDGQISYLEKSAVVKSPFPGLRPFKASEFQLFHGRDGQAEQLINRLKKNSFLAVVGSSGTGKSSLIRAGLIPQLLGGYLQQAGTNWDIAICRPGKNPVENLAVALARVKSRTSDKEKIREEFNLINPIISNTYYGILEVNELLNPPERTKTSLLIIIDQFEELFRFKRDDLGKPGIERQFVNLLLNASANPASSIYIVITMRSEFLGDCVKYRGLPEVINEGQYLIPQLNRDDIKEVIKDPIKLAGKEIEQGLVELLVNEIEESKAKQDLDQLPILQHTLMRTYQEALSKNDSQIVYSHYKACGAMENALANHAETKYLELSDASEKESFKQRIAKIIFQALTDASTDQKGGRRPTQLETIYSIATSLNASKDEVNQVINHFRDTDTSFIMPPLNTPLYDGLILDISHESLMRQWKRLRDWVAEEAEYSIILGRLSESQHLYELGKKDYLSGRELFPIAEWYGSLNPQPAWAKRYVTDYQKSFDYLKKSEQVWKRRKNYLVTLAIAGALVLLTSILWFNQNSRQNEIKKQAQKLQFRYRSQAAMDNNDLLTASLFFAEAVKLGGNGDSLLGNSNNYLPQFYLSNFFTNKSDVEAAAFSSGSDSLLLWNGAGNCYIWNAISGKFIDSVKGLQRIRLPGQGINQIVAALRQLYDFWGVDPNGFGQIISNELVVMVKVPKNVGSIYRGTVSPDSATFLTWGLSKDSTSIFSLWDMQDGKQLGCSILWPNPNYQGFGGVFNSSGTQVVLWDENNTIQILKKGHALVYNQGDLDIPVELLKLQLEVITGARLNVQKNGVEVIPMNEWQQLSKEWELKAAAHFKNCTYRTYNYWGNCSSSATD